MNPGVPYPRDGAPKVVHAMLDDVGTAWLRDLARTKKPRTLVVYGQAVRLFLRHVGTTATVDALSSVCVSSFDSARAAAGVSANRSRVRAMRIGCRASIPTLWPRSWTLSLGRCASSRARRRPRRPSVGSSPSRLRSLTPCGCGTPPTPATVCFGNENYAVNQITGAWRMAAAAGKARPETFGPSIATARVAASPNHAAFLARDSRPLAVGIVTTAVARSATTEVLRKLQCF